MKPRPPSSAEVRRLRRLVGDLDFTIVSNNCWGAHLYRALELPYATPFVDLFIQPDSYLQLLQRFDEIIETDLEFVDASRSAALNAWREAAGLRYPIAVLGGVVEINFQHYATAEDASAKWRRRLGRMVRRPGRRFFKFDDRDGATEADIMTFAKLPIRNKVCFTGRRYAAPTILTPPEPGQSCVPHGIVLARISPRYFNSLRWISTLPSWAPLPALL